MHRPRSFRIPFSERYLGNRGDTDIVASAFAYLPVLTVPGAMTIVLPTNIAQDEIPALLPAFDDDFLSVVDHQAGNLTFTVIRGEVLGYFEAQNDSQ